MLKISTASGFRERLVVKGLWLLRSCEFQPQQGELSEAPAPTLLPKTWGKSIPGGGIFWWGKERV